MSPTVEPLPHPLLEAFGRPTWLELRSVREAAELKRSPVHLDGGSNAAVVVVPGFGGSDASVGPLADWLRSGGYVPHVAGVERNAVGSAWAQEQIVQALTEVGPAILLGHSRGGQQCRVTAQVHPQLVTAVLTLGAPVRAHVPRHFVLRGIVEGLRLAGRTGLHPRYDHDEDEAYAAVLGSPYTVEVPWTSIYSRSDGLVAPQACQDPAAQLVEVDCSHRGLIESVASFEAIASALKDLAR